MKKRTKYLAGTLTLALCLGLCGCNADGSGERLSENQSAAYARIDSIVGNEVVLAWAEIETEAEEEESVGAQESGSEDQNAEAPDGGMEMPDGDMEMQSGDMELPDGGMEMQSADMELPDGGMGMQGGDMELPDGSMGMQGGDMELPDGDMEMQGRDMDWSAGTAEAGSAEAQAEEAATEEETVSYIFTGETSTMQIPVGTSVITELGVETTFSRLAEGDMLKIILETNEAGEEVIVKIYMLGAD